MPTMTHAMKDALEAAAKRARGNICPIRGIHAAAEQSLLDALEYRSLISYLGPVPYINDLGREAVATARNMIYANRDELRASSARANNL